MANPNDKLDGGVEPAAPIVPEEVADKPRELPPKTSTTVEVPRLKPKRLLN
ncbi:MAG TPA: hypothetical protein VFF06_14525 [Polyangia bacterium]|nr:hypothetical protein [Polyangia bacterium]